MYIICLVSPSLFGVNYDHIGVLVVSYAVLDQISYKYLKPKKL